MQYKKDVKLIRAKKGSANECRMQFGSEFFGRAFAGDVGVVCCLLLVIIASIILWKYEKLAEQ